MGKPGNPVVGRTGKIVKYPVVNTPFVAFQKNMRGMTKNN
jgi:hypothetical protein